MITKTNIAFAIQRAKKGYRVVVFSKNNGKLILSGETMSSKRAAMSTRISLIASLVLGLYEVDLKVLPEAHKWPMNSGPKKKAAKKAAKKKAATHP